VRNKRIKAEGSKDGSSTTYRVEYGGEGGTPQVHKDDIFPPFMNKIHFDIIENLLRRQKDDLRGEEERAEYV